MDFYFLDLQRGAMAYTGTPWIRHWPILSSPTSSGVKNGTSSLSTLANTEKGRSFFIVVLDIQETKRFRRLGHKPRDQGLICPS